MSEESSKCEKSVPFSNAPDAEAESLTDKPNIDSSHLEQEMDCEKQKEKQNSPASAPLTKPLIEDEVLEGKLEVPDSARSPLLESSSFVDTTSPIKIDLLKTPKTLNEKVEATSSLKVCSVEIPEADNFDMSSVPTPDLDENLELNSPAQCSPGLLFPDIEENLEAESLGKITNLDTADMRANCDMEGLTSSPRLDTPDLEENLESEKIPSVETPYSEENLDSKSPTKFPTVETQDLDEQVNTINPVKSPDLETAPDNDHQESALTTSSACETSENSPKKPIDNVLMDQSVEEPSVEDKAADMVIVLPSVNDGIVGDENVEDSLEAMDTCDSQESTNLIIDETSDVKPDEDTDMAAAEENILDAAHSAKKFKKTLTLEGTIIDDIDEKQADAISPSPESIDVNEKKDEEEKSENKESYATEEPKDDDVITIEQPPMPIIEIDDEDDEEMILPVLSKPDEKQKNQDKRMEVDEEAQEPLPSDDNTKTLKDNLITEEVEEESSDNLLTIATEKSMEEVMKETENKDLNDEDTTDEVFYKKECINYECPHKHKQFFRVPQFAFSYFKVNKKKFKIQYICADCYDKALEMYEEYCGLISAKQPLLLENIPSGRQEFVEIIDSSDEEDASESSKAIEPTKSAFSPNDLSLIERELHNTIKSVLNRVEIQNQLTWTKTILSERLKRLEMETEFVDNELKSLQRKADKMHEGLYSCPKIKIRQLQPLDLNSGKVMGLDGPQSGMQPIPPVGEIERPPIQINGTYYAVKNNVIASWVPCKVVEQSDGGPAGQKNLKYYRIKYLKSQHTMLKTVPAKYLAYYDPPSVRLPIGTRVIAYFDATSLARGREKINVQSAFYPGIIAEPLKPNNKFRYLIFYDDGYTQYVYHKDVRVVCLVSENVWEDVHHAARDFIQKYLTQYSINRPMVQTQKGQSMNTESNGFWLHARVVDIDCSLVLMQFEGSKSHTEWIYRGSLRLGPVFKEYQKTLQKVSSLPVSRLSRRTEPFIRYTEDEESSSQQQQQQSEKTNEANRAVARKSFGRPESMINAAQSSSQQQQQQQQQTPAVKHLNNSTIYVEDENKPKGKVVYYTAKRNLPPRKYIPHKCSPSCLFQITHNLNAYSPLSKPLLSGWERFIIRQKIKKVVTYRAPCGKILRNMKELHHYLRTTKNSLNVDNFDFSHDTNCLAEYVIESAIVQKRDISLGQEKMAIPLVNYYDNTLPPDCKYSAKVIPTEGVHINTDPEFFAGCDCEDDCSDKSKCSCWQLTFAGAKYGNPNTPPEEVGYQYKRLLEHVPTGIYECNVRCKCRQSCLNRVVQHSLQIKLQVFKTSNRGWGLRCINDVPRGSFVCVYAGHLLTEAKANEGGQDAGDEYFAELDYIEVAEQIKEGYESEVEPPEPEEEDAYQPELDDEFTPSKSFLTRSKKQSATKSTRQDDDSQERQVINFNPNADMNEESVRESSIRKLYGKDEACYVMDAKISGNLGRYFNHSCAPNMFVQNVFVDTHDLRFPWVAFFASCNIRAGTELTWNYNYEVGVVPGKVLYCQCGAPNCRLRLL